MSLTANPQGQVTGRFTIPANVPVGSKRVEFLGAASNASATFVGRGVLTAVELQRATTTVVSGLNHWWGDPLAQTFTLDAPRMCSGVDLWFATLGTSRILVQLRECQVGFPTQNVLAEAIVAPSAANTTAHTRFEWPAVRLDANTEYAIVAACDDATSALRVATLGKFDSVAQRWVTSQPYVVGALLSSSNARTWTAHQDKDLTFRLLEPTYSATTRTIVMNSVAVTAADYIMVMAAAERPSENCNVLFEITVGSDVYVIPEGRSLLLPSPYTGTITWKTLLSGEAHFSPRLHADMILLWSAGNTTGTYVSRAIPAGTGSKITVIYHALKPGVSTVTADAQDGASWTTVPVTGGTQLGDGWEEVKHVLTGFNATETRIRLNLSGTAQTRPRVRNLQVTIGAA